MATIEYELWDLEAGNRIGSYPDEAAALAQVRAGINDDGADLWRAIGLRAIGERADESRPLAQGDDLIARALATRPSAVAPPAQGARMMARDAEMGVMAGRGAMAGEAVVTTGQGSEVRVTTEGEEIVVRVRPARPDESAVATGSMAGRVYPGRD
jgi:hypothetical protein